MSTDDDESGGFWLQLMSETGGRPELPQGRRLLVLGYDDAEKALLVDRLDCDASAPYPKRGAGLQYRYLNVRDEYRESRARMGVWTLDGDPFYRPLLRFALDAASLSETVALVVASMSRPWDLLDAVREWTQILKEHIEGMEMAEGELEGRKAAVLERYREYVEPGLSLYGSLAADNTREIEENLGLELVVVVTGTEHMRELQQDCGYEEEHFDYIQLRLRDFCLRRGAALFYVSHCADLLRKYLLHRQYAQPFRLPGVLVERDALLVPAGWDTRDKVRFLRDTLPTIHPDTPYREVVFRPARLMDDKRAAPEVYAQGDQAFLSDVLSALERPGASELPESTARGDSTATVVQRNVARRMSRGGGSPRSPQKKKRAEGTDTTLTSFFHSLLNRRTSTPSDRPLGMTGGRTYATPLQDPKGAPPSEAEERSRFANSVHLSLDQGGRQQLPEYFLSDPVCSDDCSFQTDPEDPFSPPPLDRVRSPFNPPLRTLLERPDSLLPNGEAARSKEQTNGESKELTDEEAKSEEQTNGETRSKEQTNGETRSKEQSNEGETRSKEQTNGETRSSEERTVGQNGKTGGHQGLANGESRKSGSTDNRPETVLTGL